MKLESSTWIWTSHISFESRMSLKMSRNLESERWPGLEWLPDNVDEGPEQGRVELEASSRLELMFVAASTTTTTQREQTMKRQKQMIRPKMFRAKNEKGDVGITRAFPEWRKTEAKNTFSPLHSWSSCRRKRVGVGEGWMRSHEATSGHLNSNGHVRHSAIRGQVASKASRP